ncbi:MAG: adenylate/guanylate cyclase domain-containing protein [Bacteroidales bacterium]
MKDKQGHTGRRKNVCIMFLDIRDFTPFSESREPEEVVSYLNSLFGFMIEIVQKHNGIINQFLGWFPWPHSGHLFRILKVLFIQLKQRVGNCNHRKTEETLKGNIPPTRIGIGLHYGEAVTGNIGSAMRKQYSITGSVVNIASRIEKLTRQYKTEVLVSEEVVSVVDEKIRNEFSSVGMVKVKGSERMISLFRLREPVQKRKMMKMKKLNQLLPDVEEYVTGFSPGNGPMALSIIILTTHSGVVKMWSLFGTHENLNEEEMDIVKIAAWFHDVGYLKQYRDHEEVSIHIAEGFLNGKGVERKHVERITECIRSTVIPNIRPIRYLPCYVMQIKDASGDGTVSRYNREA